MTFPDFNLELFLQCCAEAGATVKKVPKGCGRITLKGKPFDTEKLFREGFPRADDKQFRRHFLTSDLYNTSPEKPIQTEDQPIAQQYNICHHVTLKREEPSRPEYAVPQDRQLEQSSILPRCA